MTVRHYMNTGRYDLCSNRKHQMVYLDTDLGRIAGMWDDGEAPYERSMLPSEVLEMLRKPGYVSFGDTKRKDTIAKIEAELTRFDCEWLTARAEELEDEARRCRDRIDEIKEAAS